MSLRAPSATPKRLQTAIERSSKCANQSNSAPRIGGPVLEIYRDLRQGSVLAMDGGFLYYM